MALWTVIAVLVAVLIVLHVIAARALAAWGVQPSKVVVVLRAVNISAVIAVVGFALWKQVG